jgi:PAS domain S-box-containing protein
MLTDLLHTIIQRNADGILVIDQDGAIRFCNPAAESLFGQSSNALIGMVVGSPLVVGETTEIDILRGGETVTAEMRAVAIEWEGEQAFLASLRDITERKRAQAEIALQHRAIEASASGLMIVDASHRDRPLIYVNPAFEQITGYSHHEALGRPVRFLYECNPDLDQNANLDRALHDGFECAGTIQCQRKDGSMIWSELRLSPIYDDMGNLTHIVGVQHDITDRKYLEAEQIENERISVALEKERELRELKDRFLTMMSHELRTPLALIRLSHDMLRQYGKIAPEEERLQYLDSIRAQVEHLTDMISDVMTISRAERMKEEFMPEVVDLITYCRSIVEEFQLNYHQTHRVQFACSASLIRASIDKRLLRRALTNLLSNAIKYSQEGSSVHFNLGTNGRYATIAIRDQGIGMSEEDQARLFEPFHRGRNADTIPGTGLGLTIVQQAVKAHSGAISFESQLEQGSTFTIKLPMVTVKTTH